MPWKFPIVHNFISSHPHTIESLLFSHEPLLFRWNSALHVSIICNIHHQHTDNCTSAKKRTGNSLWSCFLSMILWWVARPCPATSNVWNKTINIHYEIMLNLSHKISFIHLHEVFYCYCCCRCVNFSVSCSSFDAWQRKPINSRPVPTCELRLAWKFHLSKYALRNLSLPSN